MPDSLKPKSVYTAHESVLAGVEPAHYEWMTSPLGHSRPRSHTNLTVTAVSSVGIIVHTPPLPALKPFSAIGHMRETGHGSQPGRARRPGAETPAVIDSSRPLPHHPSRPSKSGLGLCCVPRV